MSLLAYAAVLFTVHVPWGEVALRTVWPKLTLNSQAAAVVVGVFGTTISPYLFFWQASEEVEDMQAKKARAATAESRRRARRTPPHPMGHLERNALFRSHRLFHHARHRRHAQCGGNTDIETAAQAASALRPLAGDFAFILFALGILGVGLIGVPVLAGSAAYALAEAMGWKSGLERKAEDARGFYGVIAVSVLAGLLIQYSPISPMKALFWSAVINGVVAVPLLVVIILIASQQIRDGCIHRKPNDRDPRLDDGRGDGSGGRADVHAALRRNAGVAAKLKSFGMPKK